MPFPDLLQFKYFGVSFESMKRAVGSVTKQHFSYYVPDGSKIFAADGHCR
jgi:hypothetical protein